MVSPQALSEDDRRTVASWAADCAARVLPLFEAEAPDDDRPRDAIARARAFGRGELRAADEIRRRFVAGRAAQVVRSPAAVAAARAAAQASGVAHMGAHALGAAAYAAKAAGLAAPDRADALDAEVTWQLGRLTPAARAALRRLPPLGEDPSGPLGSGLLASGVLATAIRALQAGLGEDRADAPVPHRETHSRPAPGGRAFWWTDTLWAAAAGLEPFEVDVDAIAELDMNCWFGPDTPPTCRAVAEHARRIRDAQPEHPIILAADGGLMDGGHRVARAWLAGEARIRAVRFTVDPEPDWVEPA